VILNRRVFLQTSGFLTGAVLTHQSAHKHTPVLARPALDINSLTPFVDALPLPANIKSVEMRASPANPTVKIPYYRIAAREFFGKVHRDMKPTRMWGFDGVFPGPTLDMRSGREVVIEWANELPREHFLPIDHTLHGAEADKPQVRMVSHVHGAKVPPESDGYPENWVVPGKSAIYHYPNKQDAAMLWYHDHTMGINRLNILAGLAGTYILRDDSEDTLRLPAGPYEIPLVICDRMFDKDSQLYYPVSDNPKAPWTPEFFGDAYLVNGKILPYLQVEPRKYRFRILNASNGRFYRLSLSNKQSFVQIGTDQGLLPAPVPVKRIVIAPGERLDLIVDFKEHAGEKIQLNDNAVDVMQFRVSSQEVKDDSLLPATLRPIDRIPESAAVKTRMLSLDEVDDPVQNPMTMLLNGKKWHDPVTENPRLNSVEIWNLINPTNDSHPIHLHLVRFQILDRRRFETFGYLSEQKIMYTGPSVPPDPSEAGWKDTVRADPGMVTRIIVPFEGYPGRYVWHCHILEHEDNEMMRPMDVLPSP
jgi:spore coat protein A, manganese oxidase